MSLRVQLFKIRYCGFYKWGTTEREFGDIGEWYRDFLEWVEAKRVDYTLTKTFDRANRYPTSIYCMAATEDDSGNFGVALWNEGHEARGRTMFVPENGPVGTVRAEAAEKPSPASRPGWMSYFWVMPERSVVVALMPDTTVASISSFVDYFKGYLRHQSEYCVPYQVQDPNTGELETKYRYKAYGDEHPTPSVHAKLEVTQAVTHEHLEEIVSRWEEINRFVLHSDTIHLKPDQRSTPQRFFEDLVFGKHEEWEGTEPERTVMRVEMNWEPSSEEEVRQVIDEWMQDAHGDQNWAGVKFRGPDQRQYRFDEARCIGEVELDSALEPETTWREEELKRAWEQVRDTVKLLEGKIRQQQTGELP
jgi:hypothetical protein